MCLVVLRIRLLGVLDVGRRQDLRHGVRRWALTEVHLKDPNVEALRHRGLEDIVKVTTFVTSTDLAGLREILSKVRARYQADGYRPASTFLVVAALASPDYLIEIEAVAAKV